MSTDRPLIGLTLDHETAQTYSRFPWYALRQNYVDWMTASGAVPVALPHEPGLVADLLQHLDGLVVTGGAFDVDPALFGASERHATVTTKDRRTEFEADITRRALSRDLPVLGICGGEQLLNVVLGGTLLQHIPSAITEALEHEQPNPRDEPGHSVRVIDGTRLGSIVGSARLDVNSAHHQAVAELGEGVVVNAVAPDGVIEGIEHPEFRFCIGVQWHPEFMLQDGDRRLGRAFVEAAAKP
ncbi:MAG: gamma-glutamyl-gamma-aminobutyrate hydrolase family protein [Rhodospirillales bacterium]|nr:gamma-glutamyl-gamma-aminobutyrate hydrolase family protein [Rhodospirillales bacterium]MCY3855182.1 gamma-glutamyl-gamma-aminobutyrate hydrolase family protein [Rhodospirillales bacterium]MCY4004594.1 gamma-glutamyl-gamma-aminobutyrate hydrolase family protein [Rhodospirillales bacterium]MCY4097058.1 gamma-glutamyl-gamma-aminobutyrate hydrolase family protein [Rhodospirillales bacterium]MXX22595.1 gamma-glutamyl-gamma-aminobutyrate hydrolase family protein [Rhodospirillales bacterium]